MKKPIDEITRKKLAVAKAFTKAYKRHMNDHVAIREAMCLKEQYPALCREMTDYDLIAGRIYYRPPVGFGMEFHGNGGVPALSDDSKPRRALSKETLELRRKLGRSNCGFCCDYGRLKGFSEDLEPGSKDRQELEEVIDFWSTETTRYKYNQLLTDEMRTCLGPLEGVLSRSHASCFFRLCCVSMDYDKLLQLGIPGMIALISEKKQDAGANGGDVGLYEGMLLAVDLLIDVCKHYEKQAYEKAEQADTELRKQQLREIAETLDIITREKPRTFRQALQLFWMYNQLTDTFNWGRMDIYLGDFYARDIDEGVLSEAAAQGLIKSLWTIISEMRYQGGQTVPNARIIVGGRGRRNEQNADRFALAAMEVTRALKYTEPNLTLRFYKGQNPALMDKAYDLLGEGCIHPGLYNDDVHVPMVQHAYNVPVADAEKYIPEGCGEIMIDHTSVGSPNNIINYITILDMVFHNGCDTQRDEKAGISTGELSEFDTFEKLLDAFKRQLDHTNDLMARRHVLEHQAKKESVAFLFMSMLTDDCIERGRALYNGGVRYLGGIIETMGLTNVADSLTAIKELVYDKKRVSLEQLVQMTDCNWEGHEQERRMMLEVPKFGNDDETADNMHTRMSDLVCTSAYEQAEKHGLDFFLNCNLNPGGTSYSTYTKASADGRRYGEPFALGNAPTAGRDKSGLTAVLNSMSRHDEPNSGYVQNLKVTKSLFEGDNRAKLRTLLDTYFDSGGCQLMVTAVNRGELEDAMKEPEKYPNLLVRVAGWTSRFVTLEKRYQTEILNRTLYS